MPDVAAADDDEALRHREKSSAPVESTIRLPSNLNPGISIGRDPVAMTMWSACDDRLALAVGPISSTVLRETNRAVPVR